MAAIVPEVEKRRAYRAFRTNPVPSEVLDRTLHAATLAPSCSNNQPWRFVAVVDPQALSEVKQHLSGGNYWAKNAPAIVLVCTDPEDDCRLSERRDYALFDTGMATMNLMLQAVREGLYTHPIAGFDPLPIKRAAGIPDETILVTLVVLGYAGDETHLSETHRVQERAERTRRPEDEVVSLDTWSPRFESSS